MRNARTAGKIAAPLEGTWQYWRPVLLLAVFAGLLLPHPEEARGQWQAEIQSDQLRIYSEVPADRIRSELSQLKALREQIAETLQLEIRSRPTNILIFASQTSYRNYVKARIPEGANRPALFVKGPDVLWVYVVYRSGWEVDLRHEMTHAYLHASLPYLPIWLDEGLAKYFELPQQAQGINRQYLSSVTWRARLRQKIRSQELETIRSLTEMKPEHYRDSWGWVYYCLHSSTETRRFLQNHLQRIQAEEVVGSFFDAINRQFPGAAQSATNYLRAL